MVLEAVADAWETRREEIREGGERIVPRLRGGATLAPSAEPIDGRSLDAAVARLREGYDAANGGWGGAPKFPAASVIDLLLRRGETDMSLGTLRAMAAGGINDQVGGGFARYAVDATWTVPHFEKMLYDNALLARAYLHGFLVSGDAVLRRTCEETLDFLLRELRGPEGGFASALDADSEGVEGRYYVWTLDQLRAELGDLADAAIAYFGATERGNFDGANVLEARGPEPADARGDPPAAAGGARAPRTTRARRQAPHRLERARHRRAGRRRRGARPLRLRRGRGRLRGLRPDRPARRRRAPPAHLQGRSGRGSTPTSRTTPSCSRRCSSSTRRPSSRAGSPRRAPLADAILARFADPANGGFFSTSDDHEALLTRRKDLEDAPDPLRRIERRLRSAAARRADRRAAPTSSAAVSQLRLAPRARAAAPAGLRPPAGGDRLLRVARRARWPWSDPSAAALERVVRGAFRPHVVLAGGEQDGVPLLDGPDPGRRPRDRLRVRALRLPRAGHRAGAAGGAAGLTATRGATSLAALPLASKGAMAIPSSAMTIEELKGAVSAGAVDTVLLALVDMQGRLQGKRLTAAHFLDVVAEHGAEACNYLLAIDVDMETVEGYAMSSWETGYGDFVMRPDFSTMREVPWQEGTVLCLADVHWEDGSDVVASPRQILRRQIARLAERGWVANAGTELEFIVFRDSYEEAFKGYRELEPANLYNIDYSLLGTARVEPLIRRIRNSMMAAGMRVENSKGECNFGQHEINFHYGPALQTADDHAIYKNGAKEIAAQEGMAITFIAKFNELEGNSCHIHLSVAREDGSSLFADEPDTFDAFVAGQLACMRELTLFFAPHINSYKRFAEGSFAPTAVAWGLDNRTCSLRVVGHGSAKRVESRLPGADVNPHLALSAMIAAGLHGIDGGLELEPETTGNAYTADAPRVPTTLREARELFDGSAVARAAFGDEVVDHYLNNARVEIDAFDAAVTDWERYRGFERL